MWYEISLRLLKYILQVSTASEWNIFSTWKEKFRISKRPYNVLFIIINTNEIPNHFTLIVFWCEMCDLLCSHSNGDIFTYEDNMLFSHVKISSFHTKAHLVFHWCLYNKDDLWHLKPLKNVRKNAIYSNILYSGRYKIFVHCKLKLLNVRLDSVITFFSWLSYLQTKLILHLWQCYKCYWIAAPWIQNWRR